MMRSEFEGDVRSILRKIGEGRLGELLSRSDSSGMSEKSFMEVLKECEVTPIPPPENADLQLSVIPSTKSPGAEWSIEVPIWTREEGMSELFLGIRVCADDDGLHYTIQSLAN